MDFYQAAILSLGWHEVTLWFVLENSEWKFNHCDAGHMKSDSPEGTDQQERAWKNQRWSKRFCYGDARRWPMTLFT